MFIILFLILIFDIIKAYFQKQSSHTHCLLWLLSLSSSYEA